MGEAAEKEPGIFASSAPICRKVVSLSTATALPWQRRLLNLIGIASESFTKNTHQILVVPDDQVAVVSLVIIILPAFVPPAKANNCGPFSREDFFQRAARPTRGIAMFIMQIATKLRDDDRFTGRNFGQTRICFAQFKSKTLPTIFHSRRGRSIRAQRHPIAIV